MSCCPTGNVYIPAIIDCNGNTRSLSWNEFLMIGQQIVGNILILADSNITLISNSIVLADATLGAFTVTLPKGIDGYIVTVKKIDSSANVVTIDGFNSETIDDQLTASIGTQYTSLTLLFYNNEWWII